VVCVPSVPRLIDVIPFELTDSFVSVVTVRVVSE